MNKEELLNKVVSDETTMTEIVMSDSIDDVRNIFATNGVELTNDELNSFVSAIRSVSYTHLDGCNAGNIMRAAKKYGFECHGYRREPEQLRSLGMPCLIHWNFNHFVVLEGFKGKYVFVNDPAVGRRKLSWEEFDDAFTGIVLTFAPTETFVREKKPHTTAAFIKERLSGQYEVLTKLFIAGFTLVFPGIILPITLQIFMDDVLIGGNTSWFNKLIMFIVATIAFQAALSLYRDLVLVKLQKKMVLTSAREFIDTLFRLPISFFRCV